MGGWGDIVFVFLCGWMIATPPLADSRAQPWHLPCPIPTTNPRTPRVTPIRNSALKTFQPELTSNSMKQTVPWFCRSTFICRNPAWLHRGGGGRHEGTGYSQGISESFVSDSHRKNGAQFCLTRALSQVPHEKRVARGVVARVLPCQEREFSGRDTQQPVSSYTKWSEDFRTLLMRTTYECQYSDGST